MKKHLIGVHVEKNAFVDGGNGLISFPAGQVITDSSKQRNGTIYDIATMDLSEYKGQITADHDDEIESVIGKAMGLAKTDTAVTISGIQFAVQENALAKLTYDLMTGGYPLDLSIETYGPWPDESDDTYYNAKLIGLSIVVVGNNRSASMNDASVKQLVHNSLAQAKKEGLDTSDVERILEPDIQSKTDEEKKSESKMVSTEKIEQEVTSKEEAPKLIDKEQNKMFKTIKNSHDFATKLSYKNVAGDTVEVELSPGATVDVSEDQAEALQKQLNDAKAPQPDLTEAIKAAVNAAVEPLNEKIKTIEQNNFDKKAKEPEFHEDKNSKGSGIKDEDKELAAMDWEARTVDQIESARLYLTNNSLDGLKKLNQINKFHLDRLKEAGKVKNSIDLSGFGNFVTSPELLTTIEGVRSDYTPLVDAVGFTETLSLEMAWLKRNGDIEMEEVGMSSEDDPDNLKPISPYSATPQTARLMEVAAVTPVSNSATRFLAVDLLTDVAEGYRTSYQRKLAQIVVARLQQAVTGTGNSVPYVLTNAVDGLITMAQAVKQIANVTANGTFIMGVSTEYELFEQQMRANLTGNTLGLFQKGVDGTMSFMSRPYIVVPDDILPSLNTNETRSFVVEGVTVTVTEAIFYADLSTLSGRVSGGLNYSLSTDAAYEDGGVVKSAFQRDELLLRGFFYRNAAVRNSAKVSSIHAAGIS
jgi:hypothetical protein